MARLLLDEQLPRLLAQLLPGHHVRTVGQMRWSGVRNGRLLDRAAEEFDALITMDTNMRFQQTILGRDIGLLVVRAPSTRLVHLEPLVPQLLEAIDSLLPGTVLVVGNAPAPGAQDP